MTNPPYPGPPAPPPGPPMPSSALQFTVQGNAFTSSFVPPTLTIDGYPAPVTSGTTTIPIQPGLHRLEVYSQWLRRYGQAGLDVSIPPNSMVQVFYAPPWHQFTTGELGFSPQKRKGIGCLVVPLAVVLVIVLITFLAIAFGS